MCFSLYITIALWSCIYVYIYVYIYIYIYTYCDFENTVIYKNKTCVLKMTIYIYCHVVSHWDDRNKITTILVFELTVASRQKMTVKNRCLYSVTSLGLPDKGRKKVEAKWLAGTLKMEVAPSSRQRKKEKTKLVVGQGSWRTEPKPSTPGRRRQKISRTRRSHFFKPVLKIA